MRIYITTIQALRIYFTEIIPISALNVVSRRWFEAIQPLYRKIYLYNKIKKIFLNTFRKFHSLPKKKCQIHFLTVSFSTFILDISVVIFPNTLVGSKVNAFSINLEVFVCYYFHNLFFPSAFELTFLLFSVVFPCIYKTDTRE